MPRRVNKSAIAIVTMAVMAMTILAGVLLVRSIPSSDPLPMARKAEEAIAKGDYRLALQCYQYAYMRSQQGKYLSLAGDVARDMGESTAAFSLWQKAQAKEPSLLEPRQHALALWLELLEMSDWKVTAESAGQIAADAEVLLKAQPEDFNGRFARGVAYINQRVEKPQLESKGVEDLNKAHEIQPTDVRVLTVLRGYWLAKGQPEQAEKTFQALIQKMPQDPTGYLALGQLRMIQERPDEAIEELKKAVSLSKAAPLPAVALAAAYATKQDFAAADALLVETLKANPDSFDAALRRIQYLQIASRATEGLALAEEWLKRPIITQGYKAHRNRTERLQMYFQAASSAIAASAPKPDATPDSALLKKAETYATTLEKEAGRATPYSDMLWGRIHRLNGNIVEATKSLEKADKGFNGAEADVRLRLAELYLLQKEPGLAQKMLASVMEIAPKYARAYQMAAVVAAQLGDISDAMNKLEAALRLEPDNREMMQLKATLLQAQGQKSSELDILRQKIGPLVTTSERLQRAASLLADKKTTEAEALYREVLEQEPANITALRVLMALLMQGGRDADARKVYDTAKAKSPDNAQIRQLELAFTANLSPEQRDQKVMEVINSEPDEYARNSQLFVFYTSRKKYDEAQKVADAMEKAKPEDERVVTMQFGLAIARQDWTKAQKYVDIAARKDLDGAEGGFYRARLLAAKGDLQKCHDELNLALQKYPSFSDGWIQLAEVYFKLSRYEDARKALLKALEINPGKGEGFKGLAQLAQVQNDMAAFEDNLKKAVQHLPEDPWVADQWMAMQERTDPDKARQIRERLLESHPGDVTNMTRLAMLYERDGKHDQAAKLIELARKAEPNDVSVVWLEAGYWQRRGDMARAEKTLQDFAAAAGPDDKVSATLLLARLYQAQGQAEKAEQTYIVATKQSPQLPGPHVDLAVFHRGAGRIDDAVKAYHQALQAEKKTRQDESAIRQQLVETLLQSRKLDEAGKEIDAFHAAFPEDPVYQLLRGTLQMLQGKTEEAIGTLTAYLQRDPNSGVARFHRGLLYMATNRLPQAIEDLSLAKQIAPNGFNFDHRTALAQAYESNGESQRGITELKDILAGNPQAADVAKLLAVMYQRAGRQTDFEGLVRDCMRQMPKDWSWPMMLGRFGETNGDLSKAVEGYKAAAEASDLRLDAVDDLLRVLISAKRYDQAIEYVTKTIPEKSRTQVVKARLAQAVHLQGDRQKARTLFGEAIAEASQDHLASLLVARVVSEALESKGAMDLLQERLTADPENLVIKYMLVAMLADQKQWDAAENLSTQALAQAKTDKDKAILLRQRGALLYQTNKREPACKAYEELLKILPDDAEAMNNAAYILAEDLNQPQEALRYAKRAVELQPRDANVADTLGWVYYLAGDLDSAVGTLVSALQYAPNNIAARFHVAMVYRKQGKLDLARRELALAQQVIDKNPNDPIAQMFQERVKKESSSLSGAAGK